MKTKKNECLLFLWKDNNVISLYSFIQNYAIKLRVIRIKCKNVNKINVTKRNKEPPTSKQSILISIICVSLVALLFNIGS